MIGLTFKLLFGTQYPLRQVTKRKLTFCKDFNQNREQNNKSIDKCPHVAKNLWLTKPFNSGQIMSLSENSPDLFRLYSHLSGCILIAPPKRTCHAFT